MSWKLLVFGKADPGRARIVASAFGYVLMAMALHGWFVPVVPAAWLRGLPAAVVMLAFSLAGAVAFALANPGRPPRVTPGGFGYPQSEDPGASGQSMLAAVGLGVLMTPFLWLALAKSLPWLLAIVGGTPHEETVTLRLEHRYSRRSCDHRAYGPALEGMVPDYLCISPQAYAAHPGATVRARLVGRRTLLGLRIDDVYMESPRQNPDLPPDPRK